MHPLAFDTETALIRPALMAPPMVCLTWQRPGHDPRIDHVFDAKPRIKSWLDDPATLFIAQFAAYDMAVVCAEFPEFISPIFKAYRESRVTCTKIRQQLLDIAGGVYRGRPSEKGKWITHKYELKDLVKRHLDKTMVKEGWRYFYDRFRDVPISKWDERAAEVQAWARVRRAELPATATKKEKALFKEIENLEAIINDTPDGARRYPLDDASGALGVWQSQEKHSAYLKDQYRQSYAQFALYLSSAWGLRTHGPGVEALRVELEQAHAELEEELQALGMVRENGTRDMNVVKAQMIAACREYGLPLRRTDAHEKCLSGDACEEHVCLDADACEAVVAAAELQGGEVPFMAYAEFVAVGKMLSNDVKMLEGGIEYPVHPRYDIAETGRTTARKPPIQTMNTGRIKKGQEHRTSMRLRPEVRQAFIPRTNCVYIQNDYPQLELYTLAQCCIKWLGFSRLGEMLNAGLDPHLDFAATLLKIPYAEAEAHKKRKDIDQARQIGKVFNFGKPGGMGNRKLQVWARKTYGVNLTIEQLESYTAIWHERLPEMRAYFARISALFGEETERASVETLFTERHRGGATYCAACNSGFQALGSDCAKAAMCLVAEAEYAIPSSPLYGCRTVAFVHDEIIAECDDGPKVHDAAFELARLMAVGANQYLPDVPILVERMKPTAMRVWSKEAEQVFVDGRLVPWVA